MLTPAQPKEPPRFFSCPGCAYLGREMKIMKERVAKLEESTKVEKEEQEKNLKRLREVEKLSDKRIKAVEDSVAQLQVAATSTLSRGAPTPPAKAKARLPKPLAKPPVTALALLDSAGPTPLAKAKARLPEPLARPVTALVPRGSACW